MGIFDLLMLVNFNIDVKLYHKTLEEIINQWSSTSYCLDILPAAFLNILPVIVSDLIQNVIKCFSQDFINSSYQPTAEKE